LQVKVRDENGHAWEFGAKGHLLGERMAIFLGSG